LGEKMNRVSINSTLHISVMMEEVVRYLAPVRGGVHLELGASTGGHLLEISRLLGSEGLAVAVDSDVEALLIAQKRIDSEGIDCRIAYLAGNYADLPELLSSASLISVKFDTVLLDAGMSGYQLSSTRGFSYSSDSRLDMRYDSRKQVDAEYIVNNSNLDELIAVFSEFGDVHEAPRVADAIIQRRNEAPIRTTHALVDAISIVYPEKMPYGKRMRKLGQVFMALREAVNNGLHSLEEGLNHAISFMNVDGKLAILTFAGHENLIVKKVTRKYRSTGPDNSDWFLKCITAGAVKPRYEEIKRNPAAHSAMLRVFTKLPKRVKEVQA
jgi:16S rRNA (cytosine1402-N4)-methyltransferase